MIGEFTYENCSNHQQDRLDPAPGIEPASDRSTGNGCKAAPIAHRSAAPGTVCAIRCHADRNPPALTPGMFVERVNEPCGTFGVHESVGIPAGIGG